MSKVIEHVVIYGVMAVAILFCLWLWNLVPFDWLHFIRVAVPVMVTRMFVAMLISINPSKLRIE